MALTPMWILQLMNTALFWRLAWAALANYTIDDTSPLFEYRAALWARNPNLTAFDINELHNGTVTFIHPDSDGTPTLAMNFSGTAIYIFVAYPSGKINTVPLGFVAVIDDVPSGQWTADQIAPLSKFLAFSNTTLTNKPHTLKLQLHPGASLYFDYAIVTSDVDPNLSPTTSSSAENTKKRAPISAIVGGVLGGFLFIALVSTPLLLRRRAMARKRPMPFIIGSRSARQKEAQKDTHPGKEAGAPPPGAFSLHPQPAAHSSKSALSVRIPEPRLDAHRTPVEDEPDGHLSAEMQYLCSAATQGPTSAELQSPNSPISPTSPALTQMAENIHRLTMSVQRLESGITMQRLSEAEDAGPVLQRPPAYGDRRV
ncbi:hypothetical protein C8R43DRAFT_1142259 [Mycena crocata]|nr:hypothetical protein C8R43DRAFT_1142259 [Mycena crocata]